MSSRHSRWLLPVLLLGVLMAALDIAIVGPALPAIREAFQASDRLVAWVFAAYLLFNLISTPLMGKLSDRYGRRAIYVLDVLIFALGSVIAALAPTLAWLLVGRAIQGLGSGGIFPVAAATIGDVVSETRRGRSLGMIGAAFGIAFLIGPILGGVLLLFSWRWIFWGPLPLALLLVPAAWRVLPATRAPEVRPWDWVGMVLMALSLTSLAVGLNMLRPRDGVLGLNGAVVALLGFGVLLTWLLLRWEARVPDPVFPLVSVRHRLARLSLGLSFGAGVLEGGVAFVPTLLVLGMGVSESKASFMLAPVAVTLAIGAPLFGWMLDVVGVRPVLAIGTGLSTLGLALLGWFPLEVTWFYLSAVMVGLGLSALLGAPVRYLMLRVSDPQERASGQALISVVTKIGQMLAIAFIGALAASFTPALLGYETAFRILAVLALALLGVVLVFPGV